MDELLELGELLLLALGELLLELDELLLELGELLLDVEEMLLALLIELLLDAADGELLLLLNDASLGFDELDELLVSDERLPDGAERPLEL